VRAITHIHTEHSWDSRLRVKAVADQLVKIGVDLALVCDHDSYDGALELRRRLLAMGSAISVPVAAEIRTDRGDVVVVFEDDRDLPPVTRLRDSRHISRVVHDAGGLVWLPHPFRGHPDLGDLPYEADIIEVFNARCSFAKNQRARDLCNEVDAIPAYGSDAHLARELGAMLVEYPARETVIDTLKGSPSCLQPVRTDKSNVMAAEIINGVKTRRPALVGYFLARYVKHRAIEWARTTRSSIT
jgi:predicted metal-dependent phosphoesterase TrpH